MCKNAIVILTRFPNNIWLNFLNGFNNYDVYISIDDNNRDYIELFSKLNTKIKIIQIDDNFSKKFGYYNSLIPTPTVPNKVLSWDKALFYFCIVKKNYKNVWFIEDDVFFLKEEVLMNIDSKYKESDLLTNENDVNNNGNLKGWDNWYTALGKIRLPWVKSMVCACRVSNKLLNLIMEYAKKHNILFYHEVMFNTLAYQNNLKIDTPSELSTIHFRTEWNTNNLNLNNLYHPIKDMNIHNKIRYDNRLYLQNIFNGVNYDGAKAFHFNPISLLPDGFNFNSYRKYSDLKNLSNEDIISHWFRYGHSENREYK